MDIQFYGSVELRTVKPWGYDSHVWIYKCEVEIIEGRKSRDKANKDEKPHNAGGIQLGGQAGKAAWFNCFLVRGSRCTSIPAPPVVPVLGSYETLSILSNKFCFC